MVGYAIVQVPDLVFWIYDFLKRKVGKKKNCQYPFLKSSICKGLTKEKLDTKSGPKVDTCTIIKCNQIIGNEFEIMRVSLNKMAKDIVEMKKKIIELEKKSEKI